MIQYECTYCGHKFELNPFELYKSDENAELKCTKCGDCNLISRKVDKRDVFGYLGNPLPDAYIKKPR